MKCLRWGLGLAFGLAVAAAVPAGEVEVLHWWTSGSEARAAAVLKAQLQAKGHVWRDFAVTGGGGASAMALLKMRALSGNPPAAAQIKAAQLPEWASAGLLANLDGLAAAEGWDEALPKAVADSMKFRGHFVAVPVNVHRVNWLWVNSELLVRVGAEPPQTWDAFFAVAEQLQRAGITPVAHGGQAWQDFTLFESVVLGVGGAGFYRQAFVELRADALQSPTMAQALATFRRVRAYVDAGSAGRDWHQASHMVATGQAAMQFMADWAQGEFLDPKQAGRARVACVPAPGSRGAFSYDVDSFAMFRLGQAANVQAQLDLASAFMSARFQESFSAQKGSIPARADLAPTRLGPCAQASARDFAEAARSGTLVPSVAHGMAVPAPVESALREVISQFWNSSRMTPEQAQARLLRASQAR